MDVGLSGAALDDGWTRLAAAVAAELPAAELDGVWIFPPIHRRRREWGTAIVSRVNGDRRRIYTARYVLVVRGKERGQFEAAIEEVGTGPLHALSTLLAEVQRRTDDEFPPTSIPTEAWFPGVADAAPQPR